MGCVQQAVLEFDEEIQAPWRPRLVPASASGAVAGAVAPARPPLSHPSRRSPSRVGVCRPPVSPSRTVPSAGRDRDLVPTVVGAAGSPPLRASLARGCGPGAAPGARLRLTRRARRLAVVLALAAGVALGSWLGSLIGNDAGDLRLAGGSSVVVQPGDTLWSIASSLDDGRDVRVLVDELQRRNGLEGAALVPGQILALP